MAYPIIIFCPPMPTRHVSRGLSKTDLLHATGMLTLDDGVIFNFKIDFPPTFVRVQPHSVRSWVVDKCTAANPSLDDPVKIVSELPPEACEIKIDLDGGLHVYMAVSAIQAPTTVVLPDGRKFAGIVTYPDCVSNWTAKGIWTVEAVQAKGDMELQP